MVVKAKRRVPVVIQLEELESGAACLDMALAAYGKWVPLDRVRTDCGISRDGIRIEYISRAAEGYGMECRTSSLSANELKDNCMLPAILRWKKDHYILLTGFTDKEVCLNDPEKGRIRLTFREFEKSYAGECLELWPGPAFVADGKRKGNVDFLSAILRANTSVILLIMITSILSSVAGLVFPAFSRTMTDYILKGERTTWYPGILYVLGGLILFHFIISIIHQNYLLQATGKLSVTSNANYIRHLCRLPMEFFSRRKAADLANRLDENDELSKTMVGEITPLLMNLLLMVFYLIIMAKYSLLLTAIGLFTIVINLMTIWRTGRIRKEISSTQFRDQSKLSAATVSGINMIDTIKATGAEDGYFERWSGFHASVIHAKVRVIQDTKYLANLPFLFQELSNHIILFGGFWLIINGKFTEGLLLAFIQYLNSLTRPVKKLLTTNEKLQAMEASVVRIYDVTDYPEEVTEDQEEPDYDTVEKLSGQVEMKHITFGYSKMREPLISDFSLTLTPGKRIALVGASGSGKSTIAKLLAGLYEPMEGDILFDGKPIKEIPRAVFKSSLMMVDQEIALFHDTVENNIKMWDNTIEGYDIKLAARDAGIHEQLIARPDGYQAMLEEGGKNLSGGERQRIEIARALAGDPSILIMDEANSDLDARTEYNISEYIRSRGITCILVAHRLSTIRDCDEIIVLDRGKVVERGNHEELMAMDGLYRKLIMTN